MKLTYGDGNLHTQPGVTAAGHRCILITNHGEGRSIGFVPSQYEPSVPESEVDVILEFKSIESARTLQDELNELIAKWSREQGAKMEEYPTA